MAIAVLTSRNRVNVINKKDRGGLYTNVTSGGVTEAAIAQGGLLGYSVPAGKIAKFKGTMVITVSGGQNRCFVAVVDNSAGRIIPVGSGAAVADIHKTIEFEGVLENDDMDFTVAGDAGGAGAACSVLVEIEELPA